MKKIPSATEFLFKRRYFFRILECLIGIFLLSSCMGGIELVKEPVPKGEEIPGLFTVIFSGRHYTEEVDAIVVFDLEGDSYEFVPIVKAKDFEILVSLNIYEALYESEFFFITHPAYTGEKFLYRILDPEGHTVGYELCPLYDPAYMGVENLVKSEYRLQRGKKIYFKARAKNFAEIMLEK